jgi:hypothetical protein
MPSRDLLDVPFLPEPNKEREPRNKPILYGFYTVWMFYFHEPTNVYFFINVYQRTAPLLTALLPKTQPA